MTLDYSEFYFSISSCFTLILKNPVFIVSKIRVIRKFMRAKDLRIPLVGHWGLTEEE